MSALPVPRFRAEHIGSLLRPPDLVDAMSRKLTGGIPDDELAAVQDRAIRSAIRLQEDIGLACVTDGEFRRWVYLRTFIEEGFGIPVTASLVEGMLEVGQPIRWKPVHVRDFKFLRQYTSAVPKVTMLGPCRVHWSSGRGNISRAVYPDLAQFWDDIVIACRNEIDALFRAGCTYIQIDETTLVKFADPESRAFAAIRGEDLDQLLPVYIDVINRVVSDRPRGMTIGLHMCRGNSFDEGSSNRRSEGGYDALAERIFNELDVDFFLLEYDTPRAGTFEPLRFLPKDKGAVLGLVSTKLPELEPVDDLIRRIDAASKYVDISRLGISPQCGFSSGFRGHPLNHEQQTAKLRRVVEVATRVWGGTLSEP
ncbi:MAG: 5-methyltetrahydropteroyltriglutamate--homocysteine S-methyltransferase [Betaproteobacteria bacterium]|nr:5-methyltetrahydropteroyltriglutamate--homocysteine S-methyltransferase [Betaproteobacteria bacterium]